MYKTLTTTEAAMLLIADDNANWSAEGAYALVEHYNCLEAETDTDIQFDAVAIRCEWSEYANIQEAARDYIQDESIEELGEDGIRQWFESRTDVIYVSNKHVLIRQF